MAFGSKKELQAVQSQLEQYEVLGPTIEIAQEIQTAIQDTLRQHEVAGLNGDIINSAYDKALETVAQSRFGKILEDMPARDFLALYENKFGEDRTKEILGAYGLLMAQRAEREGRLLAISESARNSGVLELSQLEANESVTVAMVSNSETAGRSRLIDEAGNLVTDNLVGVLSVMMTDPASGGCRIIHNSERSYGLLRHDFITESQRSNLLGRLGVALIEYVGVDDSREATDFSPIIQLQAPLCFVYKQTKVFQLNGCVGAVITKSGETLLINR